MTLLTVQAHPLSEASKAIDTAYARYFTAARESLYLWRTHAAQDVLEAVHAEKEAARIEWRQLISEIGSGA